VTFTGAGGCGKTRLARQVAVRVAERFAGGVWWVELASLADGALVTDQVARTLGLQAGEIAGVADFFAGSAALLPTSTARSTASWTARTRSRSASR
jgi:predicted ATPase